MEFFRKLPRLPYPTEVTKRFWTRDDQGNDMHIATGIKLTSLVGNYSNGHHDVRSIQRTIVALNRMEECFELKID